MKYSLKNTFPLYKKIASSGKKEEHGSHWQENNFVLELISRNFNHGLQQQKQKKGFEQKHTVSTRQKISFH